MPGTNLGTKVSDTCEVHLATNHELGTGGKQLSLFATCLGTPPTDADAFAARSLMLQLDASGGAGYFVNVGTSSSPSWAALALN